MNRKSLALILSITLAVGTISPFSVNKAYASIQPTSTKFQGDFNNHNGSTKNNVNPSGLGAYNTVADKNYIIGEEVEPSYGKSLKFYSSTNGKSLEISKSNFSSSFNGNIALQADVRVEDKNLTRNIFLIRCTSSSAYFKPITFDKNGKIINNINNKELGSYDVSKWYNIKLTIDDTTKKLNIYINDNKVDENVDLSNWTKLDIFKISQMPETNTTGVMYVDNLKIYEYIETPDTTIPSQSTTASGISVTDISLPPTFEVQKGKTLKLTYKITPEDATNKKAIWSSSNSNIVKVDQDGAITGVQKGSATITAKTEDGGKEASCKVEVKYTSNTPSIPDQVYNDLRQKWFDDITGGNYDLNDSNIKRIVDNLSTNAEKCLNTLNRDKSKNYLWDDIQDVDKKGKKLDDTPLSANIVSNYRKIETMAKAYVMDGSYLKGNKNLLDSILYALDWMYDHKYNENLNVEYGNWWNFEIGAPQTLNNICILLYDELKGQRLDKYMRTIYLYQPDPFRSGASGLHVNGCRDSEAANRVDVSKVAAAMGILTKDYDQILMARDAVETLLDYVDTGDGFYKEGSFIQHGTVPYVGSYGNVFIDGILTLNSILKNSPWEIQKDKSQILYSFITNSFEPFIYRGAALDMVRGRAISRFNTNDRKSGHAILNSLVTLAKSADEPYASHFKGLAKYWMQIDTLQDHVGNLGNLRLIKDCSEILNNPNIKPETEEEFHKNFPLMDRVIHRSKDYLFGVSMFSSRITNFECMNKENRRGWHTADGMTYLYNNDLAQYSTDFWPTVNPYRLSGTTVDTINMIDGKGNKILSSKDWVGGTSLESYGVSGMELQGVAPTATANNPVYLSLEAKKSYFMFDDEIVCLGSGINSTDNRTIETIVENRSLKDDNANVLTVDGQEKVSNIGDEESLDNIKWAHLSGNVDKSDIGYYFPSLQNLKAKRVQNTGTWQDIGSSGPTDSAKKPLNITKNYLEMWFDHGQNPNNGTYEYVLLPNKSKGEVTAYANNPDIQVLQNTPEVQAVKETKLNIFGANFFTDTVQTVDNITVNKKASVMTKEKDGILEIAVSDPTMKNNGTIEVEIAKEDLNNLYLDPGVNIIQTAPTIKLSINVNAAKGKTFKAKFSLDNSKKDNKEVAVTTKTNLNKLEANKHFESFSEITNLSNTTKDIMLILGLYDSENKLVDLKYVSKALGKGQKDKLTIEYDLPGDTKNLKLKVFTWEGKDFKDSKGKPLTKAITITE